MVMMSSTRIPRTVSASAMSERSQRQGTASEHMMAARRAAQATQALQVDVFDAGRLERPGQRLAVELRIVP